MGVQHPRLYTPASPLTVAKRRRRSEQRQACLAQLPAGISDLPGRRWCVEDLCVCVCVCVCAPSGGCLKSRARLLSLRLPAGIRSKTQDWGNPDREVLWRAPVRTVALWELRAVVAGHAFLASMTLQDSTTGSIGGGSESK